MLKKSMFVYLFIFVILMSVSIMGADGQFANQFTKEEMWEYKALTSYSEAPELANLVNAGKLPPLEDRLPASPRVIKTNIMADGIGEYGGIWRDTFATPVQSWNWGAGKTQGFFGINQMLHEPLVIIGPMWMLKNPDPLPNLATDWEWSDDGKTLTMNLVEGVKWSDGEPFTADDVLFTYNDLVLNDKITFGSKGAWVFGDKETELEKVDDYTVKWHFGEAFPIAAFYNMDYPDFSISPKHVYEKFHPVYNPDASYDDFANATPPNDLPAVTLGPWVPVEYKPGEQLIMVRNPYFWQVDEEGKQLPYISEVRFNEVETGDIRDMNLISGVADRTNLENPQTFGLVRQATMKEDSPATIAFGPFGIGYHLQFNMSRYLGVKNDRDEELRELFRKKKFRQAVSSTIDRQSVASIAFPGPLTQAWYGGYPSGSAYYDENYVKKYEYNPTEAKTLLRDLGFEDTDNDGILNWPASSKIAGDELIIEVLVREDQTAVVDAIQAMEPMFREVGIELRIKSAAASTVDTILPTGDFEAYMVRLDSAVPFVQMEYFGPIRDNSPDWHRTAAGGKRDLLDFEKEIRDLMAEATYEPSIDRRNEIFKEILQLSTENIYTVGVYEVRRGTGLHKRIRNFHPDIPPYMYNWTIESIPVQILYVEEENQFSPNFLDLIPTKENYTNRSWQ